MNELLTRPGYGRVAEVENNDHFVRLILPHQYMDLTPDEADRLAVMLQEHADTLREKQGKGEGG